jgi:2',3'-cyclic-nucleotide 2'-phosphodiesterase (5'-nucleotidase family)
VPKDPQIAGSLKKVHSAMDATVFTSEIEVPNPSAGCSPMGEFVAEAVRAGVGADVAFLDRGAVKAGIAPGKGTWWDIYRIHPWRNQVLIATCTGGQVQEALSKQDLLFAGCSFQKAGAEIADLKIGGRPADANRSYTVAINDYLFWTTPLLKTLPCRETKDRVDALLVKRLKGIRLTAPVLQGR